MNYLKSLIAPDELALISPDDQKWFKSIFDRFDGYPTLEQIWLIMDEIWNELECDYKVIDFKIDKYYSHPIWLLNGFFAEQHEKSLFHRQTFSEWVCSQKPKRVAEIGGGFGTLARMIGKSCPNVEVDIIEPYPNQIAVARAKNFKNVNYKKSLEGKYDVLISMDVFEHVPDPLALVAQTGKYLKHDGLYLINNCFYPVIQCHLPQCFHFRYTWDQALKEMGFNINQKILHGTIFIIQKELDLDAAQLIEQKSKKLWKFTKNLHRYIQRLLTQLLI